jgi:hypothetical protein
MAENVQTPNWIKSSRSLLTENCVEMADSQDAVLIRDSKDPEGGILTFGRSAWHSFVTRCPDRV